MKNKTKLFFFLLLLPALTECKNSNDASKGKIILHCKQFKTGKFIYADEKFANVSVIRNDSIQTEVSPDLTIKMKIVWLNDCEFLLIPFSVDKKEYISAINDTMHVNITEVLSDSSYKYRSTRGGQEIELVMIKR